MEIADKDIFHLYKPLGISPLDLIKGLKTRCVELRDKKMTYAGRLDPMARGVVLIIAGKELDNFHEHLKYDKSYKAKILFSFSTDSYDLLGFPKYQFNNLKNQKIRDTLNSFKGCFEFKIPPFSGYKVKGKPLFKWALDGKLHQIAIPQKKVQIKSLSIQNIDEINKFNLKKIINKKISRVTGDFRQKETIERWNNLLSNVEEDNFKVVELKISCSSGTYIRSIAHEAGKKMKASALLFDLTRTEVGNWAIDDSISIFDLKD